MTCKNEFTCKSCESTQYLVPEFTEKNCVKICPDSFYPISSNKICGKCKKECATCNTEEICKSCNEGFYHNPDTNECKEYCDDGTLKEEKTKSCIKCDSKCRTCLGTIETCTSCKDSFLLKEKCIENCPDGFYNDKVWFTCGLCHKSCLTCKGSRDKDCLSCDKNKKFTLIYGYCTAGCPGNMVRKKDGKDCLDIQSCFNLLILSAPKIFSITDKDFIVELVYKLKEECEKYKNDLEFVWDEIKDSISEEKKLTIPNDKLKDEKINLGINVKYNSIGITKIEAESTLITYKVN